VKKWTEFLSIYKGCIGETLSNIFPNLQIRDAPDIWPDNPAFFDIRYPAGYQLGQPDIRADIR
jgi:hypothetical protein